MVKIVGIELTVAVEARDGMTDDDVEDKALQTLFNYNERDNRYMVKVNGVEIIETDY